MTDPARDTWAVLLAGDITPRARLHHQLVGARVIAADSGIRHAEPLGLEPELWVGDFDSAFTRHLRELPHVPRQRHPVDKDITDGELAIEEALRRGARRLVLVGGLGGRTDHAMAHLALLARLAERGISAFTTSGAEEAHGLAPGPFSIDLPGGATFSLIGFGPLEEVTLQGAKWELSGEDIPFASTRPLSNIAMGALSGRIGSGLGVLLAQLPPEA